MHIFAAWSRKFHDQKQMDTLGHSPISKNGAPMFACQAGFQTMNSCAAQLSGQM